jgi:RimJ/RimL family protein N-acetyltransferase
VIEVPTLETSRLRLRGHRETDFADSAAMWGEPLVTRYIGGHPLSAEESWSRLLRYVGHWELLGFGYWVVEEKATGNFAGEVGFANYNRGIEPWPKDAPEVGWVFAANAHGKGFATEAVNAALAWGDARFGGRETACIIHPQNSASIRLAEKCGYLKLALTEYKGNPIVVFTRARSIVG